MNDTVDVAAADDVDLVVLAQLQLPYQTQAYEELMRRHRQKLYYLCLRILKHTADAEDVSQDVMIKVFHGLKGFTGSSRFSTWMYSIANNACMDHLRKAAVRQRYTGVMDEKNEPCYESGDDDRLQAERALASLNDRDRTLLALYYTTGLTLEECGVVMNMKLSATKMCYYRAIATLRERFGS